MIFPDCSDRPGADCATGAIRQARRAPRASSRRSAARVAASFARCLRAAARATAAGLSIRSRCATSRSKACSAPRPAPSSRTCRSRSASASTTRRSPMRSRRCMPQVSSATSASRRRATCSSSSCRSARRSRSLTFVGNKEFDTDTIKKALKDVGIAEALIFDRSALERAEQELKRQYITRGKYAATVQTTVTPQERNRVADQLHHRRRRDGQHRAHQHRRQQGVHRKAAALRDPADDAQLAVVVHEGRPVLEAEADRRPGGAAQLLPEPRLPRVQRRVDAGVDLAGQGGGVHHDQHRRGPALHGLRGQRAGRPRGSRSRRSAG